MDFEKLLERLPYNEEGQHVLNDEFVEQIIKNFFSKDGTKYAQYFMLEGFCGEDISEIDMSGLSPQYFKMITFDKETKFSQEQIKKFNPSELIEQGKKFSDVKDKGSLHDKGIKGKGTTIALLDSSFNSSIEEFGDRVKQHLIFQKVNGEVIVRPYNKKDGNGFHGETTASLAAGKECGVAPEADLILFGIDRDSWPPKGSNGEDQTDIAWTEARAALFNYIKTEVEKGAMKLPDIISISADCKTLPEAHEAEDWLNINNCAIIDSEKFWDYFSLGRKNDEDKIVLDEFVKTIYSDDFQYDKNSFLGKKIDETKEKSKNSTIMPFAGRTSIHTGKNGQPVEKYNGSLCGASFAIAQVSGLFLLAREEDKDLSFDNFVKIIKDTRMKKQEGIMYASATEIINEVKERSKTREASVQQQEVRDFEEKFKGQLFEKINEVFLKQSKTIDIITKNANDLGQANIEIPNMGILVNNKIIELSHEFEDSGISMFSSKPKNYDFVTSSFLGDAIIQDLTDKIMQSTEKMNEYTKKIEEISEQRNKRIQALQNISPTRKIFSKIRSLFVRTKQTDLSLTEEEQSILNSSLQEYKDIDDEVWKYNLSDNVVPALVKAIAGPHEFGEFSLKHRYNAPGVPDLLDEKVIPDLKKLGLESLVPQLQQALIEEYKKDLPDPKYHKIADEYMYSYVPDFSNEEDEKFHSTKRQILKSQDKELNENTLNDDLQNLSSETTISGFDKMSQNLKETQKQIEQEQTNNLDSEEEKGWDVNDN